MCVFRIFKTQNETLPSALQETTNFKWFKQRRLHTYELSITSICMGATCIGLTIGWPEISITSYDTKTILNGTFKSIKEVEIVTNVVLNLGACLGALLPPCLVDVFGRRHNFAISASIDILFWIILIFSKTLLTLLLSTALGGLATGSFIVTATLYLSEVSPSKNRGIVGTLVAFFAYTGILVGTSLSLFMHNRTVLIIICLLACIFFTTIYFWIIESPYFLYESGKTLEAKTALKYLRSANNILDIEPEYKIIEDFFATKNTSPNVLRSALSEIASKSWGSILTILLFITQMLGNYALNKYTENFIESFIPDAGRILLAFLDILSLALCIYLVEKIGKKPLLVLSISGFSFSCLILAIDTLVHEVIYDDLGYNFQEITTIIIVILYCIAYSLGITPVLPIFLGDIFPNRIKTVSVGLCISALYLIAIINQFIFEALKLDSSTYVAITAFTIIGSLGIFFCYYILKMDALTRSVQQIMNRLDDIAIFM